MEKTGMSIAEVMQAYGLSRSTVNELINTAGFPAIHIGRRVVILVEPLKEWMANQASVATGRPYAESAG